jgi:hypothetical protein
MISRIKRFSIVLVGFVFMSGGVQVQTTWAQDHVVTPSDLEKDLNRAAQTRRAQELKIESFLEAPRAKKALAAAAISYRTVEKGVPLLSDSELAELSARAAKAQSDFAAGALTNEELTYIIIALATAVIVLIALKA